MTLFFTTTVDGVELARELAANEDVMLETLGSMAIGDVGEPQVLAARFALATNGSVAHQAIPGFLRQLADTFEKADIEEDA